MQDQILEVADSGVHAGLDNCIDSYYVSPHQRKEMDKLLKMITGAMAWMEGYLVLNPYLEYEELYQVEAKIIEGDRHGN